MFPTVRDALRLASGEAFRIVHLPGSAGRLAAPRVEFSVQHDHVHLRVEARDRLVLMRRQRGLAVRLARAVNRAAARKGRVWADGYHTRPLTIHQAVYA